MNAARKDRTTHEVCLRADERSIAARIVASISVVGAGRSLSRSRDLPANAGEMPSTARLPRGRGHIMSDTDPNRYLRPLRITSRQERLEWQLNVLQSLCSGSTL